MVVDDDELVRRLLVKVPDMYPTEARKVVNAVKEAIVLAAATRQPFHMKGWFRIRFEMEGGENTVAKTVPFPDIELAKRRKRRDKQLEKRQQRQKGP
jgi:hypothetical protein